MLIEDISQLSSSEIAAVQELREAVNDELMPYYDTTFNLLRWVQGYNGNLKEAARKLRIHLKLRKSYWDLNNLVEKPRVHPIHKHWSYGITGNSNVVDNIIVNIDQSGHVDFHGMLQVYSVQEVMKARVKDMEDMLSQCMKKEEATGKQAWILYIMDLSGLRFDKNLYNLVTGALRSLSEFMADHYVELIKYFVLVNVPSFVFYLWTVVKPVLPERTRQKVRILSSSNWRAEILNFASYEALPTKWNSDGFDKFTAVLDPPLAFPENEYYCSRAVELPLGVEKIRIASGKTMLLSKELKSGDLLQWWISSDAEFGLGVYFAKDKDEKNVEHMQMVYPCFEWMPGPSIVPLDDQIVAKKDGIYRIWISNSRAWWHTLTVLCKLTVIPVEEIETTSNSSNDS